MGYVDNLKSTEKLEGHREKELVVCPVELFSELICEVRYNNECGYDTYLNSSIRSGEWPKFIIAVKKGTVIDEMVVREILCSKIMNYFSCPVAYNQAIEMKGEESLVSVNFIGEGEDFMTLLDGVLKEQRYSDDKLTQFDKVSLAKNIFAFDYLCDEAIYMIGSGLDGVRKELGDVENFDQMKNRFIEDYLYSYLIRKYLFYDSDFYFHNVGVLINKENGTFRMSPNFDFELSSMLITNERYLTYDIRYVIKNYPNVATRFYEKLKYLIIPTEQLFGGRKSIFDEMVDGSVNDAQYLKDTISSKLKGNIFRTKEIVGNELGKSCMF